jgi:hypothetical protein
LPPSRNTPTAVVVASGWEVAAIASVATAAERLGRWKCFIVCCSSPEMNGQVDVKPQSRAEERISFE